MLHQYLQEGMKKFNSEKRWELKLLNKEEKEKGGNIYEWSVNLRVEVKGKKDPFLGSAPQGKNYGGSADIFSEDNTFAGVNFGWK